MAEDLKKCTKKCTLNDTKKTKEESTTLLSIVPTRVVKKNTNWKKWNSCNSDSINTWIWIGKYRHAFSLREKIRERLSETFIDMFMLVQNFSLVNTKY